MSVIFINSCTLPEYLRWRNLWSRPRWRQLQSLPLLPFPMQPRNPLPPAAKCWSWHSTTVPKERRAEGIGWREKGDWLEAKKRGTCVSNWDRRRDRLTETDEWQWDEVRTHHALFNRRAEEVMTLYIWYWGKSSCKRVYLMSVISFLPSVSTPLYRN